MEPLLINNGKQPEEYYNARLGFWLPPDTPYGNFQLKYIKIIQRIDEANRKIIDTFKFWAEVKDGVFPSNSYEKHIFANEALITMMRRAADELISLIWCLETHQRKNEFPSKIKIDSIALLIKQRDENRLDLYNDHIDLLIQLNEIANAFKHSFINSDHNIFGAEEPRVHALALDYNNLKNDAVFHDVSLVKLIEQYSIFFQDCINWLSEYSQKNR